MNSNLTGTRVYRDKGDNGKIYFDITSHEPNEITLAHYLIPTITETVHPSKIWASYHPTKPTVPTADEEEQKRLVATGRYWLRDSPLTPAPLNPTFVGAFGPLPFVCPTCVGRLRARGCYVEALAKCNLFAPAVAPCLCSLCAEPGAQA